MSRTKPTVDLGYPTEARGRIPSFNSIEEEAEWWDTHDSADLDDVFVPVNLKLGPGMRRRLTLQLEPDDAAELGVEPATLIRMWVEEQLHRDAS